MKVNRLNLGEWGVLLGGTYKSGGGRGGELGKRVRGKGMRRGSHRLT